MLRLLITGLFCVVMGGVAAQNIEPPVIHQLAQKQSPLLLQTLDKLVSVESGSRDAEGLIR